MIKLIMKISRKYPRGQSVEAGNLYSLLYRVRSSQRRSFTDCFAMAVYYAVEFPLKIPSLGGLILYPENKVKIESGKTLVLWSVVDENGDVMEQYFKATNLKRCSKKECGEFIDDLKTHARKLRSEIRMGEVERSQQNWTIMKIQVTPLL